MKITHAIKKIVRTVHFRSMEKVNTVFKSLLFFLVHQMITVALILSLVHDQHEVEEKKKAAAANGDERKKNIDSKLFPCEFRVQCTDRFKYIIMKKKKYVQFC